MMSFKKKIPNILTLTNLAVGLLSIFLSVNKNFLPAVILIIVCVLLDFFDGKSARFFRAESLMGAELDSLSDLVSFGVAPAVLAHAFFMNEWFIIILVFFVLAGAFRLARFNVFRKKVDGYIGLPITVNGLIVPVLFFLKVNIYIFAIMILLSSFFMISALKFNKVVK